MSELLKEAVALAKSAMSKTEAEIKYQAANTELERLGAIKKNLLGIEKNSQKVIDAQITKLKADQGLYQSYANSDGLMVMSLEPLKWRHKNGHPKLAIFSLDNPTFKLSARYNYDSWSDSGYKTETTPVLPKEIRECFADVLQQLRREVSGNSVTLTTEFTGIIPDEVKDIIRRESANFDQLFIISEAIGFEKTKKAVTPPDPLLCGWSKAKKSLFLLAEFDTTAVEEAAMLIGPNNL